MKEGRFDPTPEALAEHRRLNERYVQQRTDHRRAYPGLDLKGKREEKDSPK